MSDTKILIVGAGVAGLTMANMLAMNNLPVVIIDREPESTYNQSGYMLGVRPAGGRVLKNLGLEKTYVDNSIRMDTYNVYSMNGNRLKSFSLDFLNQEEGAFRGISRRILINILLTSLNGIKPVLGVKVSSIEQFNNHVNVEFSDGNMASFDLVVIADGMYSETRKLVFGPSEYHYNKTGWGGWITWLHHPPDGAYHEYWGDDEFIGLYPVKESIGVFLGGDAAMILERGAKVFARQVYEKLMLKKSSNFLVLKALQAFDVDEQPYFWKFEDCNAEHWLRDRVVLLGDAATGFLPTAGVGASMAMDSAFALTEELLGALACKDITAGLENYVIRQKSKVERAQYESRKFRRMSAV